ncbi:MAG: hypothetical protein WAN23_08245 [Candidatus Acidiferrales bacterium]
MRATAIILGVLLGTAVSGSQTKHWTETSDETIWHGRYKNCDHGYLVNLPPGVVGHNSLPPSPNHGILISAENPGITSDVSPEEPRLIDVYDTNDAGELGSPGAYIEQYELKPTETSERVTVLEQRATKFRGAPAMFIRLRKTNNVSTSEIEELVVYRRPKEIGPLFSIVLLRTTPEHYGEDHALYVQIRNGLEFIPVPEGECSND